MIGLLGFRVGVQGLGADLVSAVHPPLSRAICLNGFVRTDPKPFLTLTLMKFQGFLQSP